MQMSYQDIDNGGRSSVPAWAQRANEPLVPTLDLPAVKRSVQADIKEMRRTVDALTKILMSTKKRGAPEQDVGPRLLEISMAARERARATSRTLREALGIAAEGSAEHKVLSSLSEEFRQALLKFQQQVEATAHLVSRDEPAAAGSASGMNALEAGLPSDGGGGSAAGDRTDSGCGPLAEQRVMQAQQLQHVETNEVVLREREEGIHQLNRSVQEVAEIFQDLALLVNEQGTQIDNIQTNIETAADSTTRGVRELARASRSQRRARSRMCIIAACVLAILIILVMVLKFGMHKLRR